MFLSDDPLLVPDDPQSLNGYSYGRQNPYTFTDPTGLRNSECGTLYSDCVGGHITENTTEYTNRGHQNWYYATNTGVDKNGNARMQPWEIRRQVDQNLGIHGPWYKGQSILDARGAEAKAQREQAQAQKREAEEQSTWDKITGGIKETFGTWEGWKNRVLPALALGACVVASVGGCILAGGVVAMATWIGDGATTGEWNHKAYLKSLAWTALGGGVAFKFARWGGAGRFDAMFSSAFARNSVRVRPATTTRGAVWREGSVNWKATRRTMAENTGFNFGFCGAGNFSGGKLVGSC